MFYLVSIVLLIFSFPCIQATAADSPSSNEQVNNTSVTAAAPIQDNSFLIEEAYNQEDGVVQHISYVQRSFLTKNWVLTQTDEWPLRTQKHQLSLTMSAARLEAAPGLGLGDTAINYRYQLAGSGDAKLAVAPRLSLLVPSGSYRLGRGSGGFGIQTNLPLSLQHNRWFVTHWNAGFTWTPRAHDASGNQARSLNVNLGQSTVWLVSHRFNVLLENLWISTEEVAGANRTDRRQDLYVSPGIRWSHNFASGLQIVPGIGVPIGVGPSAGEKGLIFYLSFEHPWGIAHSR
jgi:hypothetical protein